MNEQFISPSKITKKYDITSNTLRTWATEGRIKFIRTSEKGKRLYSLEDINKIFSNETKTDSPSTSEILCYTQAKSFFNTHLLIFFKK
jgi:hypothetical protein